MQACRRVALALALSVGLGAGVGPVEGQSLWRLGPRLGLMASVMRFEDPATSGQTEAMLGIQAGVVVRREVAQLIAAETGLSWSREGFRGEGAHTGNLVMDYITLPVLVRVRTPTRVSFQLLLGGSARLGLLCRQTEVALAGTVPCDDPLMGSAWGRVDVGGNLGAGIVFPWSGRRLSADVLASWGLRDLNRGVVIPGAARSLSFGVTFALLSPLGGRNDGGLQ